jgi:hypothetical protein
MKNLLIGIMCMFLLSCNDKQSELPEHYKIVDQVIWIVEDLDKVINHWENLGFCQVLTLDSVKVVSRRDPAGTIIRLAKANLGGAEITWIQPVDGKSVFTNFLQSHGDGAMSLVHRFQNKNQMETELKRHKDIDVDVLDDITIHTIRGDLFYTLMDTREEGKYILGYTYGDADNEMRRNMISENRHDMKINQYAFAIREAEPVSQFWAKLGFPEFQINHPVLGETKYYGKLVDHELIQGWQRHGTVAYEWCIPVKPPIVYEDHINLHGEGIHHLAFSVTDMDAVLQDYSARGYVNIMGGTWGEKGQPGSGRYEYIGLEEAGGVTMELLWSFPKQ